jgi:hypothetical protein
LTLDGHILVNKSETKFGENSTASVNIEEWEEKEEKVKKNKI